MKVSNVCDIIKELRLPQAERRGVVAKRTRSWNRAKYEQYIKSGRGQGEGSLYLPWISVHDFSSLGTVSRIAGHKTNRVHHFLSRNELNYFFLLEWSDKVLDIREQFPLCDVELAVDIARKVGIEYPRDNISGFPYVLTCDFMITTDDGFKARTVKCASELQNQRTVEKLEIERRYWEYIGVDWKIVTEHEIPKQKCRNIEWLYTAAALPKHLNGNKLLEKMLCQVNTDASPLPALKFFDEEYGLEEGSGVQILKHLLWTKRLATDMDANLPRLISAGTGGLAWSA